MGKFEKIIGKWAHCDPVNSDDYIAIYEVNGNSEDPIVSGYDTQDGEEFVISNISWNGEVLSFKSLMPSTGRIGVNKFKVIESGLIESEFTFTVIERMKRVNDI